MPAIGFGLPELLANFSDTMLDEIDTIPIQGVMDFRVRL
jgi:hypothetical protein